MILLSLDLCIEMLNFSLNGLCVPIISTIETRRYAIACLHQSS